MEASQWKAWIDELISTRATESATLDFKGKLPDLGPSEAKKEFLQDIAAFANARGGRIVYGIKEEKAVAKLAPFLENPDSAATAMANLTSQWIQPRITGLQFVTVAVDGGSLLIADVPQQFAGPFLASLGNEQWFKIRSSSTRANMTYDQIRNAYGARAQVVESLRAWRSSRLTVLNSHIRAKRIQDLPMAIVHVMPIAAFSEQNMLDLSNLQMPKKYWNSRYNLDGIQYISAQDPPEHRMQVFRTGLVEAVWVCGGKHSNAARTIKSMTAAIETWNALTNAASVLTAGGVGGAAAIGFSLINAANSDMTYTIDYQQSSPFELEDADAVFPEQMVENLELLSTEPGKITKPLMDMLWQVFGIEKCPYISDEGTWLKDRAFAPNFV